MHANTKKAIVLGYYGAQNVGDELLLAQIGDWIAELGLESVFLTMDPDYSSRVHKGREFINRYDLPTIAKAMHTARVFVLGGGGIFQEYDRLAADDLYSFPASSVSAYAQICLMARQFGVPQVLLAQGVGPLYSEAGKHIVGDIFAHGDFVSLRDARSAELLAGIGISRELVIAPDPVWACNIDGLSKSLSEKPRCLAVVLREWSFDRSWLDKVIRALTTVLAGGWTLRFVNYGGPGDAALIESVRQTLNMPQKQNVCNAFEVPLRAAELFAGCGAVLSMRLHALVMALKCGLPVASIEYDPKVAIVAEAVGLSDLARIPIEADDRVYALVLNALCEGECDRQIATNVQRLSLDARAHREVLRAALENSSLKKRSGWQAQSFDWLGTWAAPNRGLQREVEVKSARLEVLSRERDEAFTREREAGLALERSEQKVGKLQCELEKRDHEMRIAQENCRLESDDLREALAEQGRQFAQEFSSRNYWEYRAKALEASTSWKITAPLRGSKSSFRIMFNGRHTASQRFAHFRTLHRAGGGLSALRWTFLRLSRGDTGASTSDRAAISSKILSVSREKFLSRLRAHQKRGGSVFVQLPIIDWNVPLYQRPQHMATAAARQGAFVVYTTSNTYDSVQGYVEVYPNVWLTNDGSVYEEMQDAVASVYSTAHFENSNLIERVRRKGNIIVYEYIDHIDGEISGHHNVSKLEAIKAHCFNGGADLIVASARKLLQEAEAAVGPDKVVFAPNGVDYQHYAKVIEKRIPVPPDLSLFTNNFRRIAGYFGAMAPWLWSELINELTDLRPDIGFVFIGPDYYGGLERVTRRDNVLIMGPINYCDLPAYAQAFDVALIPFRAGKIAQTTSPLKLFEYFALEKPVVVTSDMLECTSFPEVIPASGVSEFSQGIDTALQRSGESLFRKRLKELALANTWDERARLILARARELRGTSAFPLHQPMRTDE